MLQAAQWEGRLLELGAVHGPRAHPLSRAVLVALDVGVAVSTAWSGLRLDQEDKLPIRLLG